MILTYVAVLSFADRAAGNELAMALGDGPGEALTYHDNNRFLTDLGERHVASWRMGPEFLARTAALRDPAYRPDWDGGVIDMDAARQIMARVQTYRADPEAPDLADWIADQPTGAPLFFVGVEAGDVLAALTATRIEADDA
jgi:hypothetical protein